MGKEWMLRCAWVPACAGMTVWGAGVTGLGAGMTGWGVGMVGGCGVREMREWALADAQFAEEGFGGWLAAQERFDQRFAVLGTAGFQDPLSVLAPDCLRR